MCHQIELKDKTIETIGELIELVGKENIVISQVYTQPREELLDSDFCLCPVDVPATAAKAGYNSRTYDPAVDGEEDCFMDYRWIKE